MKTIRYRAGRRSLRPVIALALAGVILAPQPAPAEPCEVAAEHAGVTFPVGKVDPRQTCRLKSIIDNYTTANKLGPFRTPLPEASFTVLLDRPPFAAAMVNRLGYAPYQAAMRGPLEFWASDGEGMEGVVELVYRDRTSRMYLLDGTYTGTWLPRIAGKAVVLARLNPVKEPDGSDAMDTTLVSYVRLNNRILSGVVSLLRPLIGSGVSRRLTRTVETANRLSLDMKNFPGRVMEKATADPPLPPDELALLKQMLAEWQEPNRSSPKGGERP